MRDAAFLLIFVGMIPLALSSGTAGVALWIWSAMIAPSGYLIGFAKTFNFNKTAAISAIIATMFDRTRKKPYVDLHVVLLILFVLQCSLSYFFSLTSSSRSVDLYDRITKAAVLAVMMLPTIRDRVRIFAILVAVCLAMGMHGTSEGMKYIASAGSHKVEPPAFFGDNNSFGMALLMFLPLLDYVRKYAALASARMVATAGLAINIVAVAATASRGAMVGAAAIGLILLVQSKQKLNVLALVAVVSLAAIFLTPAAWRERMDTLGSAGQEDSLLTRASSWKMQTIVALDRPFVGGGFSSMEDARVFAAYYPRYYIFDFIPTGDAVPRAAHSIYFEVLGDTGFIGLALFVGIIATGFRNLRVIKRKVRGRPDLAWAVDLAAALRLTLVAYCVSGAALSMAYFELFYVFTTLISVLRKHVEEEVPVPKAAVLLLGAQRASFALPAIARAADGERR